MDPSASAAAVLLKKAAVDIESEIRGSSMHPALPNGSRIRIRCTAEAHAYQVGDIIAILADPLIAHRVVATARYRSRLYLITRGDPSWYCDLPVTEDQILGLVTAQHDGREWQPPRACARPTGLRSILATVSVRAILAAIAVSEKWAWHVSRGGVLIATWRRGRV